ncbi:unnamed protein product [Lactuca saligna]|uniref:nicotinate phosphoribosyltransferase n=1 Tax=Lactuca saligna TaxID=75948 RepID=A0AA35ZN34_LACSI|nr:unnamed protein product [Lactuca saligna]
MRGLEDRDDEYKTMLNEKLQVTDGSGLIQSGVPNFCVVLLALNDLGYKARGIRLDFGDLAYISCEKRKFFETIGMEFGVPRFGKTGITAAFSGQPRSSLRLNRFNRNTLIGPRARKFEQSPMMSVEPTVVGEAKSATEIYHICFVVGEESVCAGLKARIDVGTYNPKASDSRFSHICDMEQDIVNVVTSDCTSMLGLGRIDIAGLRMCTFDAEEADALDTLLLTLP